MLFQMLYWAHLLFRFNKKRLDILSCFICFVFLKVPQCTCKNEGIDQYIVINILLLINILQQFSRQNVPETLQQ